MFAAAALPSRFHGAAFRSLLLAAINANDAEKTAKLPGLQQFGLVTPPAVVHAKVLRIKKAFCCFCYSLKPAGTSTCSSFGKWDHLSQ